MKVNPTLERGKLPGLLKFNVYIQTHQGIYTLQRVPGTREFGLTLIIMSAEDGMLPRPAHRAPDMLFRLGDTF